MASSEILRDYATEVFAHEGMPNQFRKFVGTPPVVAHPRVDVGPGYEELAPGRNYANGYAMKNRLP